MGLPAWREVVPSRHSQTRWWTILGIAIAVYETAFFQVWSPHHQLNSGHRLTSCKWAWFCGRLEHNPLTQDGPALAQLPTFLVGRKPSWNFASGLQQHSRESSSYRLQGQHLLPLRGHPTCRPPRSIRHSVRCQPSRQIRQRWWSRQTQIAHSQLSLR